MATSTIDRHVEEKINSTPAEKNITILNLGHEKYLFNSPFPVNIVLEDDVCIAASYDLNLFGYGESEDEALRDLCEAIVEHYEHLRDNQQKLGPLLQRDWSFLSRVIAEMETAQCN